MLYHNYPQQRTLVVAHSNQALNDVFSKTVQRDVPARYLLRLGMGQDDLDTDVDFSRTGVCYCFAHALQREPAPVLCQL
jgi:intron-binding protein aquarius